MRPAQERAPDDVGLRSANRTATRIRIFIVTMTVAVIAFGITAVNRVSEKRRVETQMTSVAKGPSQADIYSTQKREDAASDFTAGSPGENLGPPPSKPHMVGVFRYGALTYSIADFSDVACDKLAARAEVAGRKAEVWNLALINTPGIVGTFGASKGGDIKGCWHLAHIAAETVSAQHQLLYFNKHAGSGLHAKLSDFRDVYLPAHDVVTVCIVSPEGKVRGGCRDIAAERFIDPGTLPRSAF